MSLVRAVVLLLAVPFLAAFGAPEAKPKPQKEEPAKAEKGVEAQDVKAVERFVREAFKNEPLAEIGETGRLTSEDLRSAYDGVRFYAVKMKRFKLKAGNFNSTLVVALPDGGEPHFLKEPADFNAGLRPVKSEAKAKTAAAAIVTLVPRDVGLHIAEARQIDIDEARDFEGWVCTYEPTPNEIYEIRFNGAGECVMVSYKNEGGPKPKTWR